MADRSRLLFLLGAGKTASTSLIGLVNAHPDVLVMCEVYLNRCFMSRYGKKLVAEHPGMHPFFFPEFDADPIANYARAHAWLKSQGHASAYFGDKQAHIETNYHRHFETARVIFSVRDIRSWLAKDTIRSNYPVDPDIVPYAVQYASHFLESFLLPDVKHVRFDEFLEKNAEVTRAIWSFLELSTPPCGDVWWETIGNYAEGDPKAPMNWWKGHASSAVAPHGHDTIVEVVDHPFWREILPVFDKYYNDHRDKKPAREEVVADIRALQALPARFTCPLADAYAGVHTQSRNQYFKDKRQEKKGLLNRLLARR